MSLELFHVLEMSKHNGYRDIITGDQSWFVFNYPPKGGWVMEDQDSPVFENPDSHFEKMMITVIWGVYGTYIVDELPEGVRYTSTYFVEYVLKPLEKQKAQIWNRSNKHKIWLHLDNCKVHNSKLTQNAMDISVFKRAPHPPYSPDLAPSDFFLFGYIKGKLNGHSYKTREQLFQAIHSLIDEIPYSIRWKVFDEWMDRCQWVYAHDGTYFQR